MPNVDKSSLWESVLTELQLGLSSANYQTWFKDKTTVLSRKDKVIEIGCSSSYSKVWLEDRYQSKLKEIIDRLTGDSNTITFTVSSNIQEAKASKKRVTENPTVPLFEETASSTIQKSLDDANVSKTYSFSSFIVGQSNQLAYAVSKAIVENSVKDYNPFLVYGGVGVGKTHLLQAIGQATLLRRPGAKVMYLSSETFTNDMVEAIFKKKTVLFRDRYRSADLLLIDDIQFIAGRESTQEQFFHTFNELHRRGKQIVLSCDRNPRELANLQERLKNRFVGGMCVKIDPPDLELREAVLMAKSRSSGIILDLSVIQTLARQSGPSIRELEGAFLRLLAVSKLTGKKIDLAMVRIVIGEGEKPEDPIQLVIKSVGDYFSLSAVQIKSSSRVKQYMLPRQLAMYLLRTAVGKSFGDIAKIFSGKDRTTIMYSVKKVENLVKKDPEIQRIVEDLENKVGRS